MRKIMIAVLGVLATLGITLLAAPAASAAPADTAKGWDNVEYNGNATAAESLMSATAPCSPVLNRVTSAGLRINSAALIDPAETVQLYSQAQPDGSCSPADLVAVLSASTMADSGVDATGELTLLGLNGASHYTIT